MEIVTAPDFVSGDDAASFVRDLRDILVTIGSCDGKMAGQCEIYLTFIFAAVTITFNFRKYTTFSELKKCFTLLKLKGLYLRLSPFTKS